MTLLTRICLVLALIGLASGCQTTPGAPGAGDVTPNAVAGDAIEVTALDTPPSPPLDGVPEPSAAVAAAAAPAPGSEAVAKESAPALGAAETAVPQATGADTAGAETAATEPAEAAPPPPPPKSELQIACERKRGSWEDTGGGLKICIRQTRDGGKRCTRESQCEGYCLARSGTCAPVDPLFGCHDILQDNGARVTQCIE